MSDETHTLIDGKVHLYRRENSRFWQCATFIGGVNYRQSTRQANLAAAFDYAQDWYIDRVADERLRERGIDPLAPAAALKEPPKNAPAKPKARRKKTDTRPTFREAAQTFVAEYTVITHGERNASYVASKSMQINRHLNPFFGDAPVEEITAGKSTAFIA